nr:nuclear transport factor 2 family protein [Chitinophagaceae bacterium]
MNFLSEKWTDDSALLQEYSENTCYEIAEHWVEAWNNSSLDTFIDLHSDDVELISSLALRLFPESNGRIQGKKTLYDYWGIVRERLPKIHFKIDRMMMSDLKVVLYLSTENNPTKAIARMTIDPDNL